MAFASLSSWLIIGLLRISTSTLNCLSKISKLPGLPALTPKYFQWQQSPTDPGVWRRRAIGIEAVVGPRAKMERGDNDMYLMSSVRFHHQGLDLAELRQAVAAACIQMQHEHPVISHTTDWDETGFPWIQHRGFKDKSEIEAWAAGIIKVEASGRQASELRDENEKRRVTNNEGSARAFTAHLAAPVNSMTDPLGTEPVQFLFHANHIHFDGMGLRQFVGDLLRVLAKVISHETSASPTDPTPSLPPLILDCLGSNQQTSGMTFERNRATYVKTLMKAAVRSMPIAIPA